MGNDNGSRSHSDEFEKSVLLTTIINKSFRKYILGSIKSEYFNNPDFQFIYFLIQSMEERNLFVSFLSIQEYVKKDYSLSDEKVKIYCDIIDLLKKVDEKYYDTILSSVKDSVENYVMAAKTREMLGRVYEEYKNNNFVACIQLARDLTEKAKMMDLKSNNFWDDTNILLEQSKTIEVGVPIFIHGKTSLGQSISVDECLYFEGLKKGNLALVQAASNLGKTTLLVNIAVKMMLEGYRVLFYSLETEKSYLNLRSYSLLLDIKINDLKNIDKPDLFLKLQTLRSNNPNMGSIIWMQRPPKAISPSFIDIDIKNLVSKNEKPDIVIVDYLDLLDSDRKYKERRFELSDISVSLRQLAGENEIPVLAATQSSRSSIKQGSDMSNIAEDFGKVMTCDLLLALNKTSTQVSDGGKQRTLYNYWVKIDKSRFGEVGKVIFFDDVDLAKSKFFTI